MAAAASAWDVIAGQLESFAVGYSSVLTSLHGQHWSGPASAAMTNAAGPYVAWANATAVRAEQAANQARAAAAAYETAHAATVPPAAVAANRAQLAVLVATNFFGQNAPAIAANEAAYSEMWAQDAAAMHGYAEASAPAAALSPFDQAPQTTNAGGEAAQNAATAHAVGTSGAENTQTTLSQALSAMPQQLQTLSMPSSTGQSVSQPGLSLLTGGSDSGPMHALESLTEPAIFGNGGALLAGRWGQFLSNAIAAGVGSGAKKAAVSTPAPTAATIETPSAGSAGVRGTLLASAGKATPVGNLSVPHGWSAATTMANTAGPATESTQLPTKGLRAVSSATSSNPTGQPPASIMRPMEGMAQERTPTPVLRTKHHRFRMPRPAAAG